MPHSDNRLRPQVLTEFNHLEFEPKTVLDVGCGAGANLEFYQPWWPESKWTGLEVFGPYIDRFFLFDRYDSLIYGDVRSLTNFNYSLVIFGDVLEHMSRDEALNVLDRALEAAEYVVVALPIIHYPQGAIAGNEHETHLSDWTFDDFANMTECVFTSRNDVTGSFILTRN